jgi:hypothetical protein
VSQACRIPTRESTSPPGSVLGLVSPRAAKTRCAPGLNRCCAAVFGSQASRSTRPCFLLVPAGAGSLLDFFLLPHFFFVSRCRCFRFGQITVHAPRARRPESRSRVPAQPSFPASRFSGLCSCRCSARIKSLSRSPFLAQSFR